MNVTPEGGAELDSTFMAAMLDENEADPVVHLCALCESPIEDPLEECPVCAAALEEGGFPV
jgi:rubrerythrin